MFSTLVTVALFFNLAITAVFAEFAVSTPEIFAVRPQNCTFVPR